MQRLCQTTPLQIDCKDFLGKKENMCPVVRGKRLKYKLLEKCQGSHGSFHCKKLPISIFLVLFSSKQNHTRPQSLIMNPTKRKGIVHFDNTKLDCERKESIRRKIQRELTNSHSKRSPPKSLMRAEDTGLNQSFSLAQDTVEDN